MLDLEFGEQWRTIPGWEGYYEVSSLGRVRSLPRIVERRGHRGPQAVAARVLKKIPLGTPPNEYPTVWLHRAGGRERRLVHLLVLEAFVGQRPAGCQGCHNNGVNTDGRLENLRWGTPSENMRDAIRHGTNSNTRKTHCAQGHEFDLANTYITGDGWRQCRECRRIRCREYQRQRRKRLAA
jgi:NUMOD4 motif/HNH endonuclease